MDQTDQWERDRFERFHDPARVLALSDGIFAIIITLLVLEIHVPELSKGQTLQEALREIRPSFVAFLISFLVVASAWMGHRDLFALIRRTDRRLVWLNMVYLLPLCLVPFGASVLARFQDQGAALRIYGIMLVGIGVGRLVMWMYATTRTRLLHEPVDSQSRRAVIVAVAVPGVAYGIAFLIADSAPTASLVIYAAFPFLYFVIVAIARKRAPSGSAEKDFT